MEHTTQEDFSLYTERCGFIV